MNKIFVVPIHIHFWKVHLLDLTVTEGTCVVQGVKWYPIFFCFANVPIFFIFFNEKTSYFPIICFALILLAISLFHAMQLILMKETALSLLFCGNILVMILSKVNAT